MKTETNTIALEKIVEAQWNTRSEISEASVKALAESLGAVRFAVRRAALS